MAKGAGGSRGSKVKGSFVWNDVEWKISMCFVAIVVPCGSAAIQVDIPFRSNS